jgi:nicotinamidase/pyrazinamidase
MIFWDVDTQIDFMRPDGKLYVLGAEKIVPNLERLTRWARQNKTLVVASQCAHREGDEEFKLYPPHCLVGTPGQAKIPETVLAKRTVIPNRPAEVPGDPHQFEQVILEKQEFDVFTNPNTQALLERLGRTLDIAVYGVVTEICVACAARGLLDRGHRVTLVRDAIQHIDETKGHALIEEVEGRGGRVVPTADVLKQAA